MTFGLGGRKATMNWWLVVVAVIAALLTLGVSIYIVLAFTTPSELRVAILPKIVAVLGLTVAFCRTTRRTERTPPDSKTTEGESTWCSCG